jgi:hypothetical protein
MGTTMTEKRYDPYQGMYRVATAAETLTKDALEATAMHIAVEREITAYIAGKFARVDHLDRLGFGQKAAVLHSLWPGSSQEADSIYLTLNAFNELRNKYAHGNSGAEQCHQNLVLAYRRINPKAEEPISYTEIAQAICAFIGDGIMPDELKKMTTLLHKVIESGPSAPPSK